jgi:hypothetical protein
MASNYQIYVGGSLINVVAGTLDINNTIGQRSTCTFDAWDSTGTITWNQGTEVLVYDASGHVKFGGFVENDKIVKPGFHALLYHQVSCKDYHYLADKRLAARSYLNQTAGSIVYDLLNNYLAAEGVVADQIAAGPILPEVVFNYEQVSKCLDAIATQAGYWWQIDEYKNLFFQPYGGINAPFSLDGTTISQDDQLSLTHGNPKYVNRQFVTGSYDKTDWITEMHHGDGVSRSFTMSYQFASDKATIQVNGVGQTVGIKGVNTGYQFYYAEGDQTVAQDPSQTILTSSDTLTVTYKGRYPVVALAANDTLITTQQSLEGGGTGYVESKYHNAKIKTLAGAFSVASALLAHYGSHMRTLVWQSKESLISGIKQGQLITVNLPMFNLNTQMLVQTVEIMDSVDGYNIWYQVTCVGSPYDVTWQTLFQNLANQQEPQDSINVGDDSALAILTQWSALWNWAATFTATSYTCLICNTTTLCGTAQLVC